jgi:hypothetical protein
VDVWWGTTTLPQSALVLEEGRRINRADVAAIILFAFIPTVLSMKLVSSALGVPLLLVLRSALADGAIAESYCETHTPASECGAPPSASALCGPGCAPNLQNDALPLHIVPKEKADASGAVCLDGSPPGYYFASAQTNSSSTSWVLYFKGGGWCYEEDSCASRANTALGSSTLFPKTFAFSGPMDSSTDVNPSFANYNRALLWYCDGASFSGDAEKPYHHSSTNQTLFFRGKRILDLLLDELIEEHGLGRATDVLVSGGSAGGLSAYLHADRISKVLRARGAPIQRFKAAPVSGFFLLHDDASGKPTYPMEMRYVFSMQNASGGVNQRCIGALPAAEQWRCIFANYSYAHSTTPMFPLQSALDSWQMGNIWNGDGNCAQANFAECSAAQVADLNGYLDDLMRDLRNANGKAQRAGEGFFVESCLEHCGAQGAKFDSYSLSGTTMVDALAAWWDAPVSQPSAAHSFSPCHLRSNAPHQCNPTCA